MKEERILNKEISYEKERAFAALEKAKKIEMNKLKNGWKYVRCEDGVERLKRL